MLPKEASEFIEQKLINVTDKVTVIVPAYNVSPFGVSVLSQYVDGNIHFGNHSCRGGGDGCIWKNSGLNILVRHKNIQLLMGGLYEAIRNPSPGCIAAFRVK